jgi:hypothetical protein
LLKRKINYWFAKSTNKFALIYALKVGINLVVKEPK